MEKEKIFGTFVTRTEERVSKHVNTLPHIYLPPVGKFISSNDEDLKRQSFRVRPEKEIEVRTIVNQAWVHHRAGQFTEANALVRSVYTESVSLSDDPLFLWKHAAVLLSPEIGINSWEKELMKEVVSSHCQSGKVLEAFAGFNSFVAPKSGLEVVATDYCEEALARYPHSERERILFDLNTLDGTNSIGNFDEAVFDRVTICAGYKYPEKLDHIFREFHRVLKRGGKIIMVEHEHAGSTIHARRRFTPSGCKKVLKKSGFSAATVDLIPVERGEQAGKYFLTIAEK